jgi:chromosome segregation ATPase
MKILNLLLALVTMLTVGCVGLHLYIVEDELNEIRQARKFNVEMEAENTIAQSALVFARDTQYIALMAEERATELAYKLTRAASMVATLEEQLTNAIATVETQALEIQDLIDQNSELQTGNQWMEGELQRLRADVDSARRDLETALAALDDKTIELAETATELADRERELAIVREELEDLRPEPDVEPDTADAGTLKEVDVDDEAAFVPSQRIRNPFIETTVEVGVN